jgi:hypothetical protein
MQRASSLDLARRWSRSGIESSAATMLRLPLPLASPLHCLLSDPASYIHTRPSTAPRTPDSGSTHGGPVTGTLGCSTSASKLSLRMSSLNGHYFRTPTLSRAWSLSQRPTPVRSTTWAISALVMAAGPHATHPRAVLPSRGTRRRLRTLRGRLAATVSRGLLGRRLSRTELSAVEGRIQVRSIEPPPFGWLHSPGVMLPC